MVKLQETAALPPIVYTVDQVGDQLGGKGRNFVYAEIASGRLRSIKLGNSRRITHADLLAYVNARRAESEIGVPARRIGARS